MSEMLTPTVTLTVEASKVSVTVPRQTAVRSCPAAIEPVNVVVRLAGLSAVNPKSPLARAQAIVNGPVPPVMATVTELVVTLPEPDLVPAALAGETDAENVIVPVATPA